ncbi:MAG: small multi-drug export protein [Firmicutes bacterium]|nr:small multi-drug export protein [Bacillota bacterium]
MEAMPLFWQVFFLSMLPLGELRAAIPFGLAMGMEPVSCFAAAFLGNMLPVIPLLVLLSPFSIFLSCSKRFSSLWSRLQQHLQNKGEKAQRYGAFGLFLIVAVPLPLTGAWSGCFIAWLLGMSFGRALFAIAAGVLAAGIMVLAAASGILQLLHLKYGLPLLLLLLLGIVFYRLFCRRKRN